MSKDWNRNETSVQIQRIVEVEDELGVTLTAEMLDYLKVAVGEDVQVEMRGHELIVRKIIPQEPPKEFSEDFFRSLNEKVEKYGTTLKTLKNR